MLNNKTIILFNGPPGSGKDTLAEAIASDRNGTVEKFAKPIKENCRIIYGLTQEEWDSVDGTQEAKVEPHEFFFGQTCRQVQINFSELFLKPTHGEKIFGELCARRIELSDDKLFLISDSGFQPEAQVLVDKFGADNIILVRIHREGHTYEGDSRDYVYLDDSILQLDLDNNGSLRDTLTTLDEFLNNKGVIK